MPSPTMRGREHIRFYFLGFLVSFATKAFPFLWRFAPAAAAGGVLLFAQPSAQSHLPQMCAHTLLSGTQRK